MNFYIFSMICKVIGGMREAKRQIKRDIYHRITLRRRKALMHNRQSFFPSFSFSYLSFFFFTFPTVMKTNHNFFCLLFCAIFFCVLFTVLKILRIRRFFFFQLTLFFLCYFYCLFFFFFFYLAIYSVIFGLFSCVLSLKRSTKLS